MIVNVVFHHHCTSQLIIVAVPSSGRYLLLLFYYSCHLFTDLYPSWYLKFILKVSMNEFVPVCNSSSLLMTMNIVPFLSWLIAKTKFFNQQKTVEIQIWMSPYSANVVFVSSSLSVSSSLPLLIALAFLSLLSHTKFGKIWE
jgi:hypothetical protein